MKRILIFLILGIIAGCAFSSGDGKKVANWMWGIPLRPESGAPAQNAGTAILDNQGRRLHAKLTLTAATNVKLCINSRAAEGNPELNLECSNPVEAPAGQEITVDLYYSIAMSEGMNYTGEIAILVINSDAEIPLLRGFPNEAAGSGDYLPAGA